MYTFFPLSNSSNSTSVDTELDNFFSNWLYLVVTVPILCFVYWILKNRARNLRVIPDAALNPEPFFNLAFANEDPSPNSLTLLFPPLSPADSPDPTPNPEPDFNSPVVNEEESPDPRLHPLFPPPIDSPELTQNPDSILCFGNQSAPH